MKHVKSVEDLRVQQPSIVVADLGRRRRRRHMYTSERFLVTLRRTLVSDDMELYATKGEIARELGTCSATIDRAVSQLKRNSLVSVRPITDQHCAAIGNSYRLTERGIQAALAIEARIIEEEDK